MAKKNNTINMTTINSEIKAQILDFAKARFTEALAVDAHQAVIKPLNEKLKKCLDNRKEELDKGVKTLEEVSALFPRIDIDRAINAENVLHEKVMLPLRDSFKATYAIIPDGMYDAYVLKITENKRGAFLDKCKEFLSGMGIIASDTAIRNMAESICSKIGARHTSAKTLVKNDNATFVSAMSKSQFNKLFMGAFADLMGQKGVFSMKEIKSSIDINAIRKAHQAENK